MVGGPRNHEHRAIVAEDQDLLVAVQRLPRGGGDADIVRMNGFHVAMIPNSVRTVRFRQTGCCGARSDDAQPEESARNEPDKRITGSVFLMPFSKRTKPLDVSACYPYFYLFRRPSNSESKRTKPLDLISKLTMAIDRRLVGDAGIEPATSCV